MLLGQRRDGIYSLFLPSIDKSGMSFSLSAHQSQDQDQNSFYICGHNNNPSTDSDIVSEKKALLIVFGRDPFKVIDSGMMILKNSLRSDLDLEQILCSPSSTSPLRQRMSGPSFLDTLGWCTWNSFYTCVSSHGVLSGLDSFKDVDVIPRWLCLDDGWQSSNVDHAKDGEQWAGRLVSYAPNHKLCPEVSLTSPVSRVPLSESENESEINRFDSLKTLITTCKTDHSIETFLCWHAFGGYWAGVCDKSISFAHLKNEVKILQPLVSKGILRLKLDTPVHQEPFALAGYGAVDANDIHEFYDHYHHGLKEVGVDGVKVDAQSAIPILVDESSKMSGWHRTVKYHQALKSSLQANFNANENGYACIHCMCHSHQTLLSILALYDCDTADTKSSSNMPLVRCSDDYWPGADSSHGPHIWVNAINSLFFSCLGVADFDMFQTNLPTSGMHAALRSISGGPVYISDKPGQQNKSILRSLAFSDGSIPRCMRNAKPALRFLFNNPSKTVGEALVLQNINRVCNGVLGIFNIFGSTIENAIDSYRDLVSHEYLWKNQEKNQQQGMPGTAHATVYTSDVYELMYDKSFETHIVYSYHHGLLGMKSITDEINVTLSNRHDYDVLTIAPLYTNAHFGFSFAVLGAITMINAGGAVLDVLNTENDPMPLIYLLGSGVYAIACPSTSTPKAITFFSTVHVLTSPIRNINLQDHYLSAAEWHIINDGTYLDKDTDIKIIHVKVSAIDCNSMSNGRQVNVISLIF